MLEQALCDGRARDGGVGLGLVVVTVVALVSMGAAAQNGDVAGLLVTRVDDVAPEQFDAVAASVVGCLAGTRNCGGLGRPPQEWAKAAQQCDAGVILLYE